MICSMFVPLSGLLESAPVSLHISCASFERISGHLRFTRKTRYRWMANPYRIWTSRQHPCRQGTISETPSLSWRTNGLALHKVLRPPSWKERSENGATVCVHIFLIVMRQLEYRENVISTQRSEPENLPQAKRGFASAVCIAC